MEQRIGGIVNITAPNSTTEQWKTGSVTLAWLVLAFYQYSYTAAVVRKWNARMGARLERIVN